MSHSYASFTNFRFLCPCGYSKCSRDERARAMVARLHKCEASVRANKTKVHFNYTAGKNALYQGQKGETESLAYFDERDGVTDTTVISGIKCNVCKKTLAPHTAGQHLDATFMASFHSCALPRAAAGSN